MGGCPSKLSFFLHRTWLQTTLGIDVRSRRRVNAAMLGKWLWCGSKYWLICTSIIATDLVSRYMTSIGSYHVILQMLSDMYGRLIISKFRPTALLWFNLPSFRVLLFQEHFYTSLPSFVPSFDFVLFLVFLLETG